MRKSKLRGHRLWEDHVVCQEDVLSNGHSPRPMVPVLETGVVKSPEHLIWSKSRHMRFDVDHCLSSAIVIFASRCSFRKETDSFRASELVDITTHGSEYHSLFVGLYRRHDRGSKIVGIFKAVEFATLRSLLGKCKWRMLS